MNAAAEAVEKAACHLSDCHLCPHHCGERRAEERNGVAQGVCRVGQQSYVASEMLHCGEEMLLQPAHAIFFSGCTARCTFCVAARFAFHPGYGVPVTAAQLAQRILQRQAEGARSVCFIGGDPAPHIPLIVATLAELGARRQIPAVFNSNFYLTSAAIDLLEGSIDLYLPDLKFGPAVGPASCGERLGGMPGYWEIVTQAIDYGLAQGKRVIVRHLLMPGHFECCTLPVLTWLASRPALEVSLLTQYLAPARSRSAPTGALHIEELQAARQLAKHLRLVQ